MSKLRLWVLSWHQFPDRIERYAKVMKSRHRSFCVVCHRLKLTLAALGNVSRKRQYVLHTALVHSTCVVQLLALSRVCLSVCPIFLIHDFITPSQSCCSS